MRSATTAAAEPNPHFVTSLSLTRPGCVPPSRAEKMLVCLRDGRKIIGILRSFDQFANIVLEQAQERVIVGKRFADVPLGLYVIRGENVVLLGTMVRARSLRPSAARAPPCSSASCDWHRRALCAFTAPVCVHARARMTPRRRRRPASYCRRCRSRRSSRPSRRWRIGRS